MDLAIYGRRANWTRAAAGAHDDGESECVCGQLSLPTKRWRALTSTKGPSHALEDNQRQIAEAEQRQREREEREAAEARKAQEAERAAYYAKHGWPT